MPLAVMLWKSSGPDRAHLGGRKQRTFFIAEVTTRIFDFLMVQRKLSSHWTIVRILPLLKLGSSSTQTLPLFVLIATIPISLMVLEKVMLERNKPLFSSSSVPF